MLRERRQRLIDLERARAQHAAGEFGTPGALERALDAEAWNYPHLDLIDEHLVALEQRTLGTRGLMIFMQPRAGKSRRVSRHFPLWYLRRHPDHELVVASYGQSLAAGHTRWCRNLIARRPDLGLTLAGDSKASDDWRLANSEGGMRAIGVGGGITGKGANCLVIDDPVKNREEAESQVMRDKTWDWWTDDLSTRLTKSDEHDPVVVLMATRWHEDDVGGRLLANDPDNWTVLTLPAVADAGDPLGRPVGGLLMPDRYGAEWMAEQRERLGTYSFSAIYQQRPSPAEGSLFKRAHFRYWSEVQAASGETLWQVGEQLVYPKECWRFATVDLATSTKTSADWTVCSVWAVTVDGDLLLLEVRRQRIDEGDHWPMVRQMHEKWKLAYCGVESRMFGTRLVWEAGRSGLPIWELKADVDKVTRAIPATVRCEQGRAFFPADAEWLETWEHELLAFPNGTHDDQVDTFSYAALELARGKVNPVRRPAPTPDEAFWAHVRKQRGPSRRTARV